MYVCTIPALAALNPILNFNVRIDQKEVNLWWILNYNTLSPKYYGETQKINIRIFILHVKYFVINV